LSQVLFQNQNYQILQPSKYRGKISELKMREFKCHLKLRQTDNICKRSSLSWSNIFEGKKSYGLIIFRRDFLPRIVLMWVTHLRAGEISLFGLLRNYFFFAAMLLRRSIFPFLFVFRKPIDMQAKLVEG
jgi:hypothetical protein